MKWMFLASVILCLLAGCSGDEMVSRSNVCRFTFYYDLHPTSLLFSAAKNPGCYVAVTTEGDGKTAVRHVYVTSNDGKTSREDNTITTDKENYLSYVLGASNSIGLIIGLTNFNGLWAYDRSCPNCAAMRALQFSGNRQHVSCDKCGRTYALETGAITDGPAGTALMRYYCAFDGTMLRAWN